ncbi:MAG: hypothetical protein KatS3mg043_1496 [Rhodothermaceae bacterium]|nr:MAG: hypothetical protein KatS3mg043_1496 [Rhodothermaceae bacterium]
MKARYLFLALTSAFLILPGLSHGQGRPQDGAVRGSIGGTVLDAETAEPIASATVGLWRAADSSLVTGTITEQDGRFRLEGIRGGRYYVTVSFVGYATETIPDVAVEPGNLQIDLGTIRLVTDAQMLDEVEVSAERTPMQIQIDRTVYNVADAPVAIGGTATNVLETIPSIDVDVDGNISLRGSGNVAVLINGRPAPVSSEFIAAYLRQLPAGSIDRVEVIPNPSARYEPEGMAGIINIVLKQEAELGLGGTVVAGGDSRGGYNASGTFTYGRGPLNLALTYGFRQEKGRRGRQQLPHQPLRRSAHLLRPERGRGGGRDVPPGQPLGRLPALDPHYDQRLGPGRLPGRNRERVHQLPRTRRHADAPAAHPASDGPGQHRLEHRPAPRPDA